MLQLTTLLLLLTLGLVRSAPTTDESCTARLLDSFLPCWTGVTSPRTCKSASLTLGGTKYQSCSTVGLGWWSDSTNNLTLTIETPFTQERQPYSILLNNQDLAKFTVYSAKIYRIINDQEIELKPVDHVMTQYSDSNYQIKLKYQGSTMYDSLPIIYEVRKA